MITTIISCFFIALGSYFKGRMDTVMFRDNNSGWNKKWKLGPTGKLIRYNEKDWYYFGHYPKFKESFPYSSTVLVCFTDNWHKYQFIFLRCIYLAVTIQLSGFIGAILLAFTVCPILYGIGFYFGFEKKQKI
jgi:hypothetical protein